MNNSKIKRIAPSPATLRRLYALSGNLCAFPGCKSLMFNEEGNFVGKICHIEAAMPGGERFNSSMTNEQRSDFDNLILMCDAHHIETDKVEQYPVSKMKDIKLKHERKFTEDILINHILHGLKDYTRGVEFTDVQNLENLFHVYDPKYCKSRDSDQIKEDVNAFKAWIKKFIGLTPYTRKIFLMGLDHSHEAYTRSRSEPGDLYVDFTEVAKALGKYGNDQEVKQSVTEIETHGLMQVYKVEISDDRFENRHIYKNCSPNNGYDLNMWLVIKKYCRNKKIPLVQFVEELDFKDLDSDL